MTPHDEMIERVAAKWLDSSPPLVSRPQARFFARAFADELEREAEQKGIPCLYVAAAFIRGDET